MKRRDIKEREEKQRRVEGKKIIDGCLHQDSLTKTKTLLDGAQIRCSKALWGTHLMEPPHPNNFCSEASKFV